MLRITKETDYAVLLLAKMCSGRESLHTTTSLSNESGISLPMTRKILKKLVKANLLNSQRGTGGGYILSRSPANISFIEIIEAPEGPIAMTQCLMPDGADCPQRPTCITQGSWKQLNSAIRYLLSNYSLYYITNPLSSEVATGIQSACSAHREGLRGCQHHQLPLETELTKEVLS